MVKFATNYVTATPPQSTYKDAYPLQQDDSRYYVVYLNTSQTIQINVTSANNGIFNIFIYDQRPTTTYVSSNGYNAHIFDVALKYNITDETFVQFEYNATKASTYYIQIVMIANGPDTFYLTASRSMTLYFIPFVPGFPVPFVIMFSLIGSFIIWKMINKKIKIKTSVKSI